MLFPESVNTSAIVAIATYSNGIGTSRNVHKYMVLLNNIYMNTYQKCMQINGFGSPFSRKQNRYEIETTGDIRASWCSDVCLAGPENSAGSKSNRTNQGDEPSGSADHAAHNQTVDNAGGDSPSITDPNTSLTGDTGNLEEGVTDLGAGAVGAGNEDTGGINIAATNAGSAAGAGSSTNKTLPDNNEGLKEEADGTISTGNKADTGIGNA